MRAHYIYSAYCLVWAYSWADNSCMNVNVQRLPVEVFLAHPTGRKPWSTPRTHWRDYISPPWDAPGGADERCWGEGSLALCHRNLARISGRKWMDVNVVNVSVCTCYRALLVLFWKHQPGNFHSKANKPIHRAMLVLFWKHQPGNFHSKANKPIHPLLPTSELMIPNKSSPLICSFFHFIYRGIINWS